jgi:hypothetical protein
MSRGFHDAQTRPTMANMKTETLPPETEAAVWLRILHPDGKLTPEAARAILRLSFPETERDRMHELSAKARAGALTPAEEQQMDAYERAGALLSILKSKARQVLKKVPRSA